MKIERIVVYRVRLPLKEGRHWYQCGLSAAQAGLPKGLDCGMTPGVSHSLETVVVQLESGGMSGWGEASPGTWPIRSSEWAGSVFHCIRDTMAGQLLGQNISSGDDLTELLQMFRGNRHAKAAIDLAWWDLKARIENRPLHELIGAARQSVAVGCSLDQMPSIEAMFDAIAAMREQGFSRVELKMRPGWDLEMLRVVRDHLGGMRVHVDFEGALSLDHAETLHRMDDFMLEMVEQPILVDDFVGHAMLQEAIHTPVCLDESITTYQQAEMAIDLQSCRYMNLKLGKLGGMTTAMAVHDLCQKSDIGSYVGANPQSSIGLRHAICMAAKSNCEYPTDWFPAAELLADDLVEPLSCVVAPLEENESRGALSVVLDDQPGIGPPPDVKHLEHLSLDQAEIAL